MLLKSLLKKITMGFLMLYSYNLLIPAKALIPINVITVIITSVLSFPGLIILIVIRLLIY